MNVLPCGYKKVSKIIAEKTSAKEVSVIYMFVLFSMRRLAGARIAR